jgi:acetoin utilization protein AcuB
MKVKQRMTPSPITVTPETTYRQASDLMKEHRIRRLPVVDSKGLLVGIVSQSDLLSTAPSPATTLSVYEIVSLLDKLTIKEIMSRPVYAVDETCSLSGAARFMIDHRFGCLPVVRDGDLAGIITETDIFKTFVEVLGGGEPGMRIDLKVPDETGVLADVARAFADAGCNIVSLTTFRGEDTAHAVLSVKERGGDEKRLRETLSQLREVEVDEFRPSGVDQLLTFGG